MAIPIPLAVSILVGFTAAHVGSLLTKLHAPQWIKAGVTFVLSALAGCLTQVAWDPSVTWTAYLLNVFAALLAQVAQHYTGATNPVAFSTAGFGLGKNPRRNKAA